MNKRYWSTDEERYWQREYRARPYTSDSDDFDTYRPAYKLGAESHPGKAESRWEEFEDSLERKWDALEDKSEATWDKVKEAAKDAWHRVERSLPGDADNDGR